MGKCLIVIIGYVGIIVFAMVGCTESVEDLTINNMELNPTKRNSLGYRITWETKDAAVSQVCFGKTETLEWCTEPTHILFKNHAHSIYMLEPETRYYYEAIAWNHAGKKTSGIQSFTTDALPDRAAHLELSQDQPSKYLNGYIMVTTVAMRMFGAFAPLGYIAIYNREGTCLAVYPGGYMIVPQWDGNRLWFMENISWSGAEIPESTDGFFFSLCDFAGNEYLIVPSDAGHHDFVIRSDKQLAYIAYDARELDAFDKIVEGDRIVEMDLQGDSAWEWTVFDHVPVTLDYPDHQVGNPFIQLPFIAWSHGNSLVYDESEAAYYMNFRNINTLMKIDRSTGDVLWQMGGMHSDFTFIGNSEFEFAHGPVLMGNNQILIFDNGTLKGYSRALEIRYDETNWTVETVWEYRETPDFFSAAVGYAERMPNGNTLVTDGLNKRLVEVTPTGEITWEATTNEVAFRAYYLESIPGLIPNPN
jgi:hypothetical protein